MDTTNADAGSGAAGLTRLDRRLEALIDAGSEPVAARPAEGAGSGATVEDTLGDVAAELRGLRQAFLSLPSLDLMEERLTAIEVALDRLTEAVAQVLARPDDGAAPTDAPLRGIGD